jgi:antitoxin component of RelBE/YafQ-DinJ toxin-antitoxin module
MKRNPGRPPKQPDNNKSSITMKVDADFKRTVIGQADGYGLTITEYFRLLVARDCGA